MTVNVALSALAQIFLKPGMTANDVQASLRNESISSTIYYGHDLTPSDLGVGLFWSKPDPRCRLSRECHCLRHILSSRFGIVITTMAGYLLFEENITVLKVTGPLLT
jgi:hypothetical protein